MNRVVQIGDKSIGDGNAAFIVFEAGPTHDGLESALKLTDLAAQAGADAIKFQIIDPERLISNRNQLFTYEILADRDTGRRESKTEPLYDILKRRYLHFDDWRKIKARADSLGINFFATVGFADEAAFVKEIGCQSIKIASGDVNHAPLLKEAAKTGLCIQLDTGNSTLGEIEQAVDILRSNGNEKIVLHQCPSGYPARDDGINLNIITTLRQMFPYPTAYSDHTPGWDMDIAAVALGANLIEKTITLDRATPSVEHIMSLEPDDCASFIRAMRLVEKALGQPRRILQDAERESRKAVRRSAFLAAPVRSGQMLGEADVVFRRPGFGLTPDQYAEQLNARFVKDLPVGSMLARSDFA